MGDRQAIVPHIGFELEGSLLDAAADENRPGLPQAAGGRRPPLVKFTGFSPYGMTGQVLVFAREGVLPSTVRDMAARAIAGSGTEYLVEDGGSSDNL